MVVAVTFCAHKAARALLLSRRVESENFLTYCTVHDSRRKNIETARMLLPFSGEAKLGANCRAASFSARTWSQSRNNLLPRVWKWASSGFPPWGMGLRGLSI